MTIKTLIKTTRRWALQQKMNVEESTALRHKAILQAHAHYLNTIPVYQNLAKTEGIERVDGVSVIASRLMLTDDIFKSYQPTWLEHADFYQMNQWLSSIFHQPIDMDVTGLGSVNAWIERLGQHGIKVVYSSGTSGVFSFVPRDSTTWTQHVSSNMGIVAATALKKKLGSPLQRLIIRVLLNLAPDTLIQAGRPVRLDGYDAVFLDFARGKTGNQLLAQEIAPFFRRHTFLYPVELSPDLLRLVLTGKDNPQYQEEINKFIDHTTGHQEQNYLRVIKFIQESCQAGQKVFIFGTTMQYKMLCEINAAAGSKLALPKGSLALFGGGWKSFSGERISREKLVETIRDSLQLPQEMILEGYSMTEINAFMLRCKYGRFHIPPTIEPVIFNEALEPIYGSDIRGVFGFMDPLAHSYPGFIISGDYVHFVTGDCPCGKNSPALTEIGRAFAKEVKGCGGITASVQG